MKMVGTLAVLLACLNSWGQTNDAPFKPEWFAPPQMSLRPAAQVTNNLVVLPEIRLTPLDPAGREENETSAGQAVVPSLSQELTLAESLREFDLQMYYRLEKQGFFTRIEKSDSLLDRTLDSVFTAEVVRFRKVTVSCSLYTAIKRKNPFCLLNPLVLDVWW